MRLRFVSSLVLLLAVVGCKKATHIEIEPRQPVLRTRIEYVQMIGKVMGGRTHYALERVKWSSDDPFIATIGEDGRLRALASGRTTVRATFGKLAAEVPVEVTLVEELRSDTTEVALSYEAGDPARVKVEAIGYDGRPMKDRPIFFKPENDRICRVDGVGQLWPVTMGETVVVAYHDDREVRIRCKVGK